MKHPERVEDFLGHIVEAIERALSYIQELDSVEAFEEDHKTQAAVIRCIEIIGEAANRIHSGSSLGQDACNAEPDDPQLLRCE